MPKLTLSPSQWGVGTKITLFTFALTSAILAALLTMITYTTSSLLEERANARVAGELMGVSNMVEVFNTEVNAEVASFSRVLAASFPSAFTIDPTKTIDIGGKPSPTLKSGDATLNLDFAVADNFTKNTGATATIFAAMGEDFIRVSTSVKKEDGSRAVGTLLDRTHAGYQLLREGKSYVGLATLFGRQFLTQYDPIKDSSGHVIGILYVGVDLSKTLTLMREKIRAMKVGDSGYFYVLNAAPGKNYGTLLIHPHKEGVSIADSKDAAGHAFIKEMLEKKSGMIKYPWVNTEAGETSSREKTVVYTSFKNWNWVIAGGTYTDEITAQARSLRNRYIVFGLIALVTFAVLLFVLVRSLVSRPLHRTAEAARQIASGDLTVNLTISSKDELGRLMGAMNGISSNLSEVVGNVRRGAENIASASGEIATGNLDLCTRTEQQASSLEETTASMAALTAAVTQNDDNAHQANVLTKNASAIAERGGVVVAQVVDTMDAINQSSRKIVDIISVIDGIAFQTNILALNAAVEAARAGEQGRGFAVVAAEVRNLAQRSAAAAREIKALISDSVDKVDAGSKLVAQAGSTMADVVSSVGDVEGVMEQITAASEMQRAGIDKVNSALVKMEQGTQQNAALVEQASAAAASLQDQAATLEDVVRVFRLG